MYVFFCFHIFIFIVWMCPMPYRMILNTFTGFVQSLEFLKKSGNLQTTFPDLEKVWKLKVKSWKMAWSLEFFSRSSRCLKASWNLCNVADFNWPNSKTLIINGCTVGDCLSPRASKAKPSLQCPTLHYGLLCLQCIMVYLFHALVEQRKQYLFAFM